MPKTSATLTSKLMEVEKSTDARSSSVTFSRSQCSRTTTEEWRIITPFGRPVDPEVKMTCDRFSGTAPLSGAVGGFRRDGVALAVEQQQRGRALRQAVREGGLGDDQRDRGVFEHVAQPLARVRRVQRHVRAARPSTPSIAATSSGVRGRQMPTRTSGPTPRRRSALASRFARALQLRVRQPLAAPGERDGVAASAPPARGTGRGRTSPAGTPRPVAFHSSTTSRRSASGSSGSRSTGWRSSATIASSTRRR